METKALFKKRRILLFVGIFLPGLCLLIVAMSALSNLGAPTGSPVIKRLDKLQKARIAELLHLRRSLGNEIWPGFGDADIPVIVWNEGYAFLVGLESPAEGWETIPNHTQQGIAWELVSDDNFYGQPYYRQSLPTDGPHPQAFTVLVGDQWLASLQTKEWMLISLSEQVRQDFGVVFPHWAFARLNMGSSERYVCTGLLHESFHAYQGFTAQARLESGERVNSKWADSYLWESETFQEDWQMELDILADSLRTASDRKVAELAEEFLALRARRRSAAGLSADLIKFEQQREWVEGLAKYTEIAIWQRAFSSDYEPAPVILPDPDFEQYTGFPNHWKTELSNLTLRATDKGDGRFYYTGMAQAFLLDRLMPQWKERIFHNNIWLEDLLAEAVSKSVSK